MGNEIWEYGCSMSELRWHPLLDQWVVVAAHRQDRPQMPSDWCPFCPGSGPVAGKVPDSYDVALYPNDFPAFSFDDPHAPGACDVVLYSPEHTRLPSELPISQWEKIVGLWTRRTAELSSDPRVKHVMIFENAGEAVGVTMPHPHGQIYAFPFVPPRMERELSAVSAYRQKSGECLYCAVLADEQKDTRRIISENRHFVAFAPHFARFPYETLIYARRHAPALADLRPEEARDFASILSLMRKKYDALFGFPMPLMMVLHQSAHFYVEFLPLQRSALKLKYLAAAESASWTFLNDVMPEHAAEALRRV
jgi:UDPglucose--hexose-1-phosphate uridylyltransferase